MKTSNLFAAVGLYSLAAGFSAQAAIQHQEFTVYQNNTSPDYADFTAQDLNVSYTASTGAFSATSQTTPTTGMAYQTGSQTAGTQGAYVNSTGFTGYYSLTATIQDISGSWEVTGGTLDIYGNLFTSQTVSSGQTGDLLLSISLMTGLNTINAGVGTGDQEFDFRLGSVTGGNAAIEKDFLGVANGSGYIDINVGKYNPVNTYSDLTSNFSNETGKGFADTFVPEPSMYAGAGSLFALISLVSASRKNRQKTSVV